MESGGQDSGLWKGKKPRESLRRPFEQTSENCEEPSPNPDPDMKPDVHDESGDIVSRSVLQLMRQNDDPSVKSTLSPLAKEFVPRTFPFELSPYAEEFVPSTSVNECSSTNNEVVDETLEYYVTMVQQLICEVTLRPAAFESEVRNLTSALNEGMVRTEVLQFVAEIIVNQGIEEPNFRYNAVRICRHLSENLKSNEYRNLVLNTCKNVFGRSEGLMSTSEGQATCRGFALFLGEIFSQFRVQGERLTFIGERIPQILERLLSVPSSDNLKCVCQVIKFVGAHIEDQERASNIDHKTPIMDEIISKIDNYAVTIGDTLDRCIKGMLLAVVELRTANYGRRNLSPAISTESIPTTTVPGNPIRYGPDGQQLTADEALFMDSVYDDVPNGEDYGYEDNYESEEMDDEMCTAFEDFLRDMPH